MEVSTQEWVGLQARVRQAYDDLVAFARTQADLPATGDATGGLAGAIAHVAYHLGAIRQMVKALGAGG